MLVLIDTHEKKPWEFPVGIQTKRMHMHTGDYTVADYKSQICIERKSLEDLTCSVSDRDLQRYCSQLARLKKWPYRCVIVEGTIAKLMSGKYRAKLPPDKMLARIMDTSLRFKIPMFWAGTPKLACTVAVQFMRSSIKQIELGN